MGFPAGYPVIVIPRLLLNLAFVLAYIKYGICCILSLVGLAEPLQLDSSSWQEFSEISSAVSYVRGSDIIRESLPVLTFRKFVEGFCEMEEDIMCAVCLRSFEDDDEIRELCNCCHIFHRDCLDKWIDHLQMTCPLCRRNLLPQTKRVDAGGGGNDELWIVDRISYLFGEDLVDDFSL